MIQDLRLVNRVIAQITELQRCDLLTGVQINIHKSGDKINRFTVQQKDKYSTYHICFHIF